MKKANFTETKKSSKLQLEHLLVIKHTLYSTFFEVVFHADLTLMSLEMKQLLLDKILFKKYTGFPASLCTKDNIFWFCFVHWTK